MTNPVYRTRLVPSDFNRSESALNYFADPADARTYLEAVLRLRYDAETTAWAREESAGEKWSMHPDGFDGRAVVMGCQVHESADDPIDAVREAVAMLEDDGLRADGGQSMDEADRVADRIRTFSDSIDETEKWRVLIPVDSFDAVKHRLETTEDCGTYYNGLSLCYTQYDDEVIVEYRSALSDHDHSEGSSQ